MRTFAQPAGPQSTSPLLNLPTEIRLYIWTLLLKSPQILVSNAEYEHRERQKHQAATVTDRSDTHSKNDATNYRKCSNLSAQLLACCQQVHNECEPILYGENVISLYCASVKVDHFAYDLDGSFLDQYWLLWEQPKTSDLPDLDERAFCRSLSRFRRYRLFLSINFVHEFEFCGRLLEAVLWNKEVAIETIDKLRPGVDDEWKKALHDFKGKFTQVDQHDSVGTRRHRL